MGFNVKEYNLLIFNEHMSEIVMAGLIKGRNITAKPESAGGWI